MLYQCDCKAFNSTKNNYRNYFINLTLLYSKYFLTQQYIKQIKIVLFEPGGLLDEAIILDKILQYITNINYSIDIMIYVLEPINTIDNNTIKQAQDFFYTKYNNYQNITISFFSNIFDLKKEIDFICIDYLLFLSLDPYEYINLLYYKNIQEDIKEIKKKVSFFLDISLFSINGFFYDIELSCIIYNKYVSDSFYTQYRSLGKNNFFKYNIYSINNFI